ncbi:Sialin like protein [Argiope bruennichi]|uniref:Sialin like protein n=1 Tax=Argiope bruennichi TaxID=94029 RepID=A0A8T0F9K2_ARGBR|nr:Sialin like protein [Argiope bruennichi]
MNNQDCGYKTSNVTGLKNRAFQARYILTLLGFFGFFCVYALRVNLNVAMVAMVQQPRVQDVPNPEDKVDACPNLVKFPHGTNSSVQIMRSTLKGEFDWDSNMQGLVLGSFYFGYVVTQIPGGIAAEKYGAKWLFGIGILITAVFSLLTPMCARWSVWALIIARAIEGLFGCLWFLLWITLVYDSPDSHPRISDEELLFIHLGQDEIQPHRASLPWKSVVTSVPMWGLVVTHFGQNWGFYTLLTDMPTYLSNVLHFNIEKNGVVSALPNLIQAFVAVIASWTADKLLARGKLKITTIRKIMNSIALYSPALCVLPIAFIGCEPVIIVILLTVGISLNGFIYSGFNVIHVDMSPEFAGTLMGITNCIANLPGFLAPSFVGWIVQDGHTLQNWAVVFVTTSAIFIISGTVFNLFCTAELQPWGSNAPPSNENNEAVAMDDTTPEFQNSTIQLCKENIPAEFTWDVETQRIVLVSFIYGYCLSQIPAGLTSDMYGGKWHFGISVLVVAFASFLIPSAARISKGFLISVRIIQGMAAVGTLSVVWFLFWSILIFESPEDHKFLSGSEIAELRKSQDREDKIPLNIYEVPWRTILTSTKMWALIIAFIGYCWTYTSVVIEFPIYFSKVLKYDIIKDSLESSLLFVASAFLSFISGIISDSLRSKNVCSITKIRKTMNSLGTLVAITGTFGSIFGCIAIEFNKRILQTGHSMKNWGNVFFITAAVICATGMFFNFFADAEEQNWIPNPKSADGNTESSEEEN